MVSVYDVEIFLSSSFVSQSNKATQEIMYYFLQIAAHFPNYTDNNREIFIAVFELFYEDAYFSFSYLRGMSLTKTGKEQMGKQL